MKVPRDVSGADLVKALRKLGYSVWQQTGSHIRLTVDEGKEHRVTIPNHDPIKIGTLVSILDDVANHLETDRAELIERLRL